MSVSESSNQSVLEQDLAIAIQLRDLSTQLINGGGEEEIYERMLETAMTVMEADFASIQVLTEAEGAPRLRLLAWKNFHPESARFWEMVATGSTSACGAALQRGERFVITDAERCEFVAGTRDMEEYRRSGIRAVQSTPLVSRSGRLLGMISTHWRAPHTPAERGLRVLDVLACQVADMMERKQQEERRAKQARLLDLSYDAILVRDAEDRIVYWNNGARELYGFSAEEAVGKVSHELLRTKFPEPLPAIQEKLLREGRWEGELNHARRDGQRIATLSRWALDRDAEGRPAGVLESNNDITVRKRAEEQFRTLADSIPNLVGWADADGYATWHNRRWYEYTGTTPEQMEGWGWQSVHDPAMLPLVLEKWRSSIATGEPFEMEFPLRGADGGYRWFLTRAIPVRDDQGKVARWFGTSTDVTEKREARLVLARDKQELERLVAERTARLHELVGELEHFSYTITHDLRSPLRAMLGLAEMMKKEPCGDWDREKGKDFLRRISESAERMDRLIVDALDYTQSVRQEMRLEDVDAGGLLRGMLDSYPELQSDRARIVVDGPLPVVLANQAGLTQAFSNLLGNAVKFVRPGEKADVRVWAEHLAVGHHPKPEIRTGKPESEWVRIWVEDKGIGISKEALPRVFDMFWRANSNYEGTGIGLALVRKVVERMGGRVGAESQEGRGSRFWIELRCGEGGLRGLDGKTVLYVEDDESDRKLMERAFEKMGFGGRLQLVKDGRAAVDYLSGAGQYADRRRFPLPALVLLDLKLPQVPGFDVLAWIRGNPDFELVPVVVFSSSALADDQQRAKELGASDFVVKPGSDMSFGEILEGLNGRWLTVQGRKMV